MKTSFWQLRTGNDKRWRREDRRITHVSVDRIDDVGIAKVLSVAPGVQQRLDEEA